MTDLVLPGAFAVLRCQPRHGEDVCSMCTAGTVIHGTDKGTVKTALVRSFDNENRQLSYCSSMLQPHIGVSCAPPDITVNNDDIHSVSMALVLTIRRQ